MSGVSLSKITLDKRGQAVSLEKKRTGFGRVRINLNWSRPEQPKRSGLLGGLLGRGRNTGIDLDIGCLFELADGGKGAVQALGNAFGSLHQPPWIQLSGDDRTGSVDAGEDLFVNGDRWDAIKRVLVYAFIYEGAPNWAAADGVVTVEVPNEPAILVRLTETRNDRGMCGIVLLENVAGGLRTTRVVDYFEGHPALDRAFGWGLRWAAGSKD